MNLQHLPDAEKADLLALLDELEARKRVSICQNDFLAFIAALDATYKFGTHLKRLGALLTEVEQGHKDRIAVSMAPRMGKSQMISIYYPAWYLGKNPTHKVIVASHTAELAVDMARKVRNLMQTAEYRKIFPNTTIASDAKAAGKWNTSQGGEYFAIGTGGALAGRGADLIVADDPLSEQDIKAGNFDSLDALYEWFSAGLRTRLMPGGKICILHCLTGDTRILQADGTEKLLRDVRPGDTVASYDGGVFRPAKVLGWANQGIDQIYSLRLNSGVIIRGNERHPLLVNNAGVEQWVTIKNLQPGMRLVSTTGAPTPPIAKGCAGNAKLATTRNTTPNALLAGFRNLLCTGTICARLKAAIASVSRSSNQAHAQHAAPESTTTRKTPTPPKSPWGTTGSGEVRRAIQKVATSLCEVKDFAVRALTKKTTPPVKPKVIIIARPRAATPTSKDGMGSLARTTTEWLSSKTEPVPFVESPRTKVTPQARGKFAGWRSTIAIRPAKFVPFFATLATSSSKSGTPPTFCAAPLNTLSTTLDEIVEITLDGFEDVYDIQVEGTENFVANGIVSHNTRWHQRDLIGRLIKDSATNPDGDQYEIFEFPAILNEDSTDPDNPPKSLWPEQWSLESLLRTKASMSHILWQWNAQYMQNPTASESAIIKREWIKWWPHEDPPKVDFIVQSYDTALTTKTRSDYSVCHTWGVFFHEEDDSTNAILLNKVKGKWEFPELKQMALEQYQEWEPDSVIVEAKASGQPLIDEMRRSGIFVQDYSPGKGQDKIARLNAVADMFASGHVWFPETHWAQATVEEIVSFPAAEHDDEVDACTLALARIRKGGLLSLRTDNEDNEPVFFRRKGGYY
jgi:hypothetical protein